MKNILGLFLAFLVIGCVEGGVINDRFYVNVIGDGISDDTISLNVSLAYCSENNLNCVVGSNKSVLITGPIYLWGDSGLIGEKGAEILINFTDIRERYVVNLGLMSLMNPGKPFSGSLSKIKFRVLDGPTDKWQGPNRTPVSGRIVQCWNCKHASIDNNEFEIGLYFYAATASHINGAYMFGPGIKQNITISYNKIYQDATGHGMECIGINNATNVLISHNYCYGSGDDMIGVHFCNKVAVVDNEIYGVDGRIFMSSTSNSVVSGNHIERIASTLDGQWYPGASLIYVGYEYPSRNYTRSTNITIENNVLSLPIGSIDRGGMITIRGSTRIFIAHNIVNNGSSSSPYGVWIAPWSDPATTEPEFDKYYIKNVSVIKNKFTGVNQPNITQTGQCKGYKGFVNIINNKGNIGRLSCPGVVNESGNIEGL